MAAQLPPGIADSSRSEYQLAASYVSPPWGTAGDQVFQVSVSIPSLPEGWGCAVWVEDTMEGGGCLFQAGTVLPVGQRQM